LQLISVKHRFSRFENTLNVTPSAPLNQEIKAFVKAKLSPEVVLKEIVFMEDIPKTRSGKILRRALRAQDMGLPIGDHLKIKDA
jgi:acetyl-CoA synthetase